MQITVDETNSLIEEKMQQMQEKFGDKARLLMLEILMLKNSLYDQLVTRYIPVPEWNEYHSYPSVSALRNYIANATKNGFEKVFFRKGKRIFIDEAKFFEWLRNEKGE